MPLPWPQVEDQYRAHLLTTGKRPATCKTYLSNVRRFAHWCALRESDIATIEPYIISLYLVDILDQLDHNTAALRLSCIRSFYKFCRARQWRSDDPTLDLSIKWEDKPPRQPYAHEEIAALLNACTNPRDRAMILLAYDCGLRVSEVVSIREPDVKVEQGVIYLHGKGGKLGWCVPSPRALAAILPFLGKSDGVLWWTRDGRPLTVKAAQKNLGYIAKRAGIRRAHWHKLRTTFANDAIRAGVPLEDLQVLMRHADIKTTRHYAGAALDMRALRVARQLNLAELVT